MVIFNSYSNFHKSIFGSVPSHSEHLYLRISSESKIESPKVHISLQGHIDTVLLLNEMNIPNSFVYECLIPGDLIGKIGIYSYYFSYILDGKVFNIGQDPTCNGKSIESPDGVSIKSFKLTVFNPEISTPSWFKEQCFYHIFVDSFYGDKEKDISERKKIEYLRTTDGKVEQNRPRLLDHIELDFDAIDADQIVYKLENPGRSILGGDIRGIEKKLDYLQDLGVTSIYLSPIFFADSNHKYNATNFMMIDPHYGVEVKNKNGDSLDIEATIAANDLLFSSFCNELNNRSMHVILDGVFNHCGVNSIYFDRQNIHHQIGAYPFWSRTFDLIESDGLSVDEAKKKTIEKYTSMENPRTGSPYAYPDDFSFIDLFDIEPIKMPASEIYEYHAWANYTSLPSFSRRQPSIDDCNGIAGFHVWNNLAYRHYFFESQQSTECVVEKWARLGIAGWRMDATPEISVPSWQKISSNVQNIGQRLGVVPQVLIGEVWQVSPQYLLGDTYHSLTNYPLKDIIDLFIVKGDGTAFINAVKNLMDIYPPEAFYSLFNMLSSHDTRRLFYSYKKSIPQHDTLELMACAYGLLMTLPGVPVIFYGDEVAIDGELTFETRKPFPWHTIQEDNGRFTLAGAVGKYHSKIKKHIAQRKEVRALIDGDLKFLYSDMDVIVFSRTMNNQYAIVVSNRSNIKKRVKIHESVLPKNIEIPSSSLIERHDTNYYINAFPLTTEVECLENNPGVSIAPVSFVSTCGQFICWSAVTSACGYRVYGADSQFDLNDNHYNLFCETNDCCIEKELFPYQYVLITPFDKNGELTSAKSVKIGENELFETLGPCDDLSVTAYTSHFEIEIPEPSLLFKIKRDLRKHISLIGTVSTSIYKDHHVDTISEYQYLVLNKKGELKQSDYNKLLSGNIDVIINVYVPAYTPQDELITMIHRGNGWCFKEAPLQKISPTHYQYRTTGRIGERLEAINFCRRHSGFCVSMLYLSGINLDPSCSSHWAYVDFDTHVSTTIQNNNGCFIYNAFVNRWTDIPIAPISNVHLAPYENITENNEETVVFSLPRDVRFFVNGVEMQVTDNVSTVKFPLEIGRNEFVMHLELIGRHQEKYGFKESKYKESLLYPVKIVFIRR